MKILIVGSWISQTYEEPLYAAFCSLGIEAIKFKWGPFFGFPPLSNTYDNPKSFVHSIWYRAQNKFIIGPTLWRINNSLLRSVKKERPDAIFLYRATHIWASTIQKIKESNVKILVYNNDDPFTEKVPHYVYRHFLKSLPLADWIFSYREKNIFDYKNLGFNNVSLLRSSYTKEINFPLNNAEKEYDIIFIGHFEDDGRDKYILELLEKTSLKIGLWGLNWRSSSLYSKLRKHFKNDICSLFGAAYNEAINKSEAALVFLSKINNDGYTRRVFEIPAAQTAMISEYSNEIKDMFEDEVEVLLFKNMSELLEIAKKIEMDKSFIRKIAHNGYLRLKKDGHEIKDRALQIKYTLEAL